MTRLFESLNNLLLTKYAQFKSIKRINSFSWNRWVKISCSTQLRESTIKNLHELLKNQINKQISSFLLKIKHHSIHLSSSIVKHHHSFNSSFKQISSCLVIHLLKSVLKNFEIISLKSLMLIYWNHQVLRHSFMKMTNHSLKQ